MLLRICTAWPCVRYTRAIAVTTLYLSRGIVPNSAALGFCADQYQLDGHQDAVLAAVSATMVHFTMLEKSHGTTDLTTVLQEAV